VGRLSRNRKAISGLETAIVLIAFVIVASAFSYAVLNMGFLATQKSQQVVLGGLAAASSALLIDGPAYGYSSECAPTCTSNAQITTIIFWLKTAPGATSVDLNPGKTTISYENPRGLWPNIYYCSDGKGDQIGACVGKDDSGNPMTPTGTVTFAAGGNDYMTTGAATNIVWEVGSGMMLTPGGKVRVTIDLSQITSTNCPTGPGCVSGYLSINEGFEIIVKPPIGSFLSMEFVAPAQVAQVDDLTSLGEGNYAGATNPSLPTGGGTTTVASTTTTSSSGSESIEVAVNDYNPSVPSGLAAAVSVDGVQLPNIGSKWFSWTPGTQHTLSAQSPADIGEGTVCDFYTWTGLTWSGSDPNAFFDSLSNRGELQTQTITLPAATGEYEVYYNCSQGQAINLPIPTASSVYVTDPEQLTPTPQTLIWNLRTAITTQPGTATVTANPQDGRSLCEHL